MWEIRLRLGLDYRVLYVAKFQEAIYVLHVFEKRSQQTPTYEVDLARARYRQMLRERDTDATEDRK